MLMVVRVDIDLTESEMAAMAAIPDTSWFTQFIFRNAESPVHPHQRFAIINEMKQTMVTDWITGCVKGKRVLDLFSANGGFTIIAALAGAKEVVGVEFSQERIKCAEFVASTIRSQSDCRIEFKQGDVYDIGKYFDEPFDVVLCLGGLYHVADPAYVLRQIGCLVKERLILQTAQVLSGRGNRAKFLVRRKDQTTAGMTSIRAGYGTWYCSPGCLRELLLHGGFRIIEERQTPLFKRLRFPWYLANCVPL
jgi:tRNA (mo5U34)-methyltransferase